MFDSFGRFALGQISPPSNYSLTATVGSLTIAGVATPLTVSINPAAGSYTLTGRAVSFTFGELASAGSITLGGIAAPLVIGENVSAGALALSGVATSFAIREIGVTGSLVLTGAVTQLALAEAASAGSFSLSGIATSLRISFAPAPAAYTITGYPATDTIGEPVLPGSLVIAETADFAGSGFDTFGGHTFGQISQPGRTVGESFAITLTDATGAVTIAAPAVSLIVTVNGASGNGHRKRDPRVHTGMERGKKRPPEAPAVARPAPLPLPPFRDAPALAPSDTPPLELVDRDLIPADLLALQDQIHTAQDVSDIQRFLRGIDQDEQDARDIADILAILDGVTA